MVDTQKLMEKLGGMSDEELDVLLEKLVAGGGEEEVKEPVKEPPKETPAPPPVVTRPPEPVREPSKPTEWSYDKFAETFRSDPREGLDYVDQAQYGMPVRRMVPALMVGVAQLMKEVQDLRNREFVRSTSSEALPAVEQIIKERGWTPNAQAYDDALAIAKAKGLVKGETKEAHQESVTPPPRIPRGVTEPQEDLSALDNLSPEQIEEVLFKKGVISQRRFTQDR